MSSRHSQSSSRTVIPLGIVLVVIGLCIVSTAILIWIVVPLMAVTEMVEAPVPIIQQSVDSLPSPVHAVVVTPTPDPKATSQPLSQESGQPAILLSESPLPGEQLEGQIPSVASVEDAPRTIFTSMKNQPRRLVIPRLNMDVPVSQVSLLSREVNGSKYLQWAVPRGLEVGWHNASAPLGEPGNTVLNGHNNVHGAVFQDLIEVTVGDQIIVYDTVQSYVYEVTQQELLPENGQPISIRLQNASWIGPTDDERLTLVSCWPYATNAFRLVVVAKPVNAGT